MEGGKVFTLSVWRGSLQAISEALRAHPAGVWGTHALPGQDGAVHPAAQAGLLMPCHHAGDQPVIPTSSDHGREEAGDSGPESFMALPLQGSRRGRV